MFLIFIIFFIFLSSFSSLPSSVLGASSSSPSPSAHLPEGFVVNYRCQSVNQSAPASHFLVVVGLIDGSPLRATILYEHSPFFPGEWSNVISDISSFSNNGTTTTTTTTTISSSISKDEEDDSASNAPNTFTVFSLVSSRGEIVMDQSLISISDGRPNILFTDPLKPLTRYFGMFQLVTFNPNSASNYQDAREKKLLKVVNPLGGLKCNPRNPKFEPPFEIDSQMNAKAYRQSLASITFRTPPKSTTPEEWMHQHLHSQSHSGTTDHHTRSATTSGSSSSSTSHSTFPPPPPDWNLKVAVLSCSNILIDLDQVMWSRLADENPTRDLTLHLGDQIYADMLYKQFKDDYLRRHCQPEDQDDTSSSNSDLEAALNPSDSSVKLTKKTSSKSCPSTSCPSPTPYASASSKKGNQIVSSSSSSSSTNSSVYSNTKSSIFPTDSLPGFADFSACMTSYPVILNHFRSMYRSTWLFPAVSRALRSGMNFMMPDDHEIFNNLGPSRVNDLYRQPYIRAGRQAYYEYQHQLRRTVDTIDYLYLFDACTTIAREQDGHGFGMFIVPLSNDSATKDQVRNLDDTLPLPPPTRILSPHPSAQPGKTPFSLTSDYWFHSPDCLLLDQALFDRWDLRISRVLDFGPVAIVAADTRWGRTFFHNLSRERNEQEFQKRLGKNSAVQEMQLHFDVVERSEWEKIITFLERAIRQPSHKNSGGNGSGGSGGGTLSQVIVATQEPLVYFSNHVADLIYVAEKEEYATHSLYLRSTTDVMDSLLALNQSSSAIHFQFVAGDLHEFFEGHACRGLLEEVVPVNNGVSVLSGDNSDKDGVGVDPCFPQIMASGISTKSTALTHPVLYWFNVFLCHTCVRTTMSSFASRVHYFFTRLLVSLTYLFPIFRDDQHRHLFRNDEDLWYALIENTHIQSNFALLSYSRSLDQLNVEKVLRSLSSYGLKDLFWYYSFPFWMPLFLSALMIVVYRTNCCVPLLFIVAPLFCLYILLYW